MPRGPTREALQAECGVPEVTNHLQLRWWYHQARQVLSQGESYAGERDLANSYVYYKRFLGLAVRIPEHNAYKQQQYLSDRLWLQKERDRVFTEVEQLCKVLDEMDARNAARPPPTAPGAAAGPGAGAGAGPEGQAGRRHSEQAPAGLPSTALQPGSAAAPGPGLGTGPGGARPGPEKALSMQDMFSTLSLSGGQSAAGTAGGGGSSAYPSVQQPTYMRETPSLRKRGEVGAWRKVVLPSSLVPQFERVARPNTNSGRDGVETCGILAGRLSNNVLRTTTLIIPKQTGTSDTCSTTHEEEVFTFMLERKLITMGWIHTHPKQDCFLSSVDLHTHCGYQLMLPEAVAVVLAPTDQRKRVGIFRLVHPGGLKLIQRCELKGFHEHPTDVDIYEDVPTVEWDDSAASALDIVDQR